MELWQIFSVGLVGCLVGYFLFRFEDSVFLNGQRRKWEKEVFELLIVISQILRSADIKERDGTNKS
jgi:hypothetical protein